MEEKSLNDIPFEVALTELEQLVGKMENGGLSLDELIKGFERGRVLAAGCRKKLDALERKITMLSRDDGGKGVWQDFDAAAGAAPESARSSVDAGSDDLPF